MNYSLLEPVGEAGVVPPLHPLVIGQVAGPLRLEVEQALRQRVAVVERGRRHDDWEYHEQHCGELHCLLLNVMGG